MELTRAEAIKVIIVAIKEAQEDIVDEPETVDERTRPIGDLQDFDSLTSITVTIQCFASIEYEDEPPFPSLFIQDNRALMVGEVADRLITLVNSSK